MIEKLLYTYILYINGDVKMNGIYVNGWIDIEEAKEMEFPSKEEAHEYVKEYGGIFVFSEDGEKKAIYSDDERGKRSFLLGKSFGYF